MTEEINTALVVLGVGMITVFVILGLVVLSGHLLIKIVNAYFPEASIKSPLMNANLSAPASNTGGPSKSTLAAIVAAVDLATGGKGKAQKVEKID